MTPPSSLLGSLLVLLLVAGCAGQDTTDAPPPPATPGVEPEADTLLVSDAWARTGPQGGMSAAYLRITNRTATADTLLSAASGAADLVELHESYAREEGMRGMRRVPQVAVPAGSSVTLEPGGTHAMLIRLTRPLAEGDSVALSLTFAHHGTRTLMLPVVPPGSSGTM